METWSTHHRDPKSSLHLYTAPHPRPDDANAAPLRNIKSNVLIFSPPAPPNRCPPLPPALPVIPSPPPTPQHPRCPGEDTGALYTFGWGKSYCLGNGTGGKCQSRAQPERVKPLTRANVAHVACGTTHVAALVKPRPPQKKQQK